MSSSSIRPQSRFFLAMALLSALLSVRAAAADVDVHGDRLLLGELAPEAPATLVTFDLGAAPQPGQSRLLTRAALMRRLQEAMVDTTGLVLPASVQVHRGGQTVTEPALRELIAGAITPLLPTGMHLREVAWRGGLLLADGALTASVEPPRAWQVGRQLVRVQVAAGVSQPRVLPVTIELDGAREPRAVLVARGAEVRIVARADSVVVTALGLAQQNGALDELIAVLPASGAKLVKARVRDAHTVEVEL